MYVDPSGGDFLNYAHLRSPVLRRAAATCALNFWFYMHVFTTETFDAQLVALLVTKSQSTVSGSSQTFVKYLSCICVEVFVIVLRGNLFYRNTSPERTKDETF